MEIKPKRGKENSSCSTLFLNILLKGQQQQQQQKTLKCEWEGEGRKEGK